MKLSRIMKADVEVVGVEDKLAAAASRMWDAKEVLSCSPDASLVEAEEIMRAGQVRRLPVVDAEGILVGIVSLNDLALLSAQEVAATLAAICAPRHGATEKATA